MPANNYSKIVPAIYRLVLQEPGIRQDGLFKRLSVSKSPTHFNKCILAMCAENRIARVRDGASFKLYLQGMVPQSAKPEPVRPRGIWQEASPMNKAKGGEFFRAFDEAFGLQSIMEFPFLLNYLFRGG